MKGATTDAVSLVLGGVRIVKRARLRWAGLVAGGSIDVEVAEPSSRLGLSLVCSLVCCKSYQRLGAVDPEIDF